MIDLKNIKNPKTKEYISKISSVKYAGTNPNELAALLDKCAKTDLEKAFVIYVWLALNLQYDAAGFFSNQTNDCEPVTVLKQRKGVCSGYARLFRALANIMKLKCENPWAYAKGVGFQPGQIPKVKGEANHEYNKVFLNNSWFIIDNTWGSGILNGMEFQPRFNLHYFLCYPDQFIYEDFPKNPADQLLKNPITWERFFDMVLLWPEYFFIYGFKAIEPNKAPVKATDSLEITLHLMSSNPRSVLYKVELIEKGKSQGRNQINEKPLQQGCTIKIKISFASEGKFKVQIFALNPDQAGGYQDIICEMNVDVTFSKKN